ncbi:MAG TPA: biopolymer transporter ExbD, partial [Verrucomicrobiae bacterium]|nr:biopolymer transporter ExbD [Verrucomicrobiae bacterium]
ALKLALPESNQPKQGTTSDAAIIVTIGKTEPRFYLDQKLVTFQRLQEELTARAQKNPRVSISIRPDTDAPVGQVVRVMDAAKAANIRDINMFTKAPAPK